MSTVLLWVSCLVACASATHPGGGKDILEISKISDSVYVHVSYLKTQDWGLVPCNGAIYISGGEAVVFDTPVSDDAAEELIRWVREECGAVVKAVVVNHFHDDCLGSLGVFHRAGASSYAHEFTRQILDGDSTYLGARPIHYFRDSLIMAVGAGGVVENRYFGPGHTRDNIVSYIPSARFLFGGCMVKAVGANKGYLGDADTLRWGQTVCLVRRRYPLVQFVVPGHGDVGGRELLDYTIDMFPAGVECREGN